MITLRLIARDAAALRAHLLNVIPETRRAEGCKYCYSCQSLEDAKELVLVQGWDSREHQ